MNTGKRGSFIISLAMIVLTPAIHANTTASDKIENYISRTWQTLIRDTNDCVSLHDEKVKMQQVLYFPAKLAIPNTLLENCNLKIKHLPTKIEQLGKNPFAIVNHGLLYLPHPYIVPGGIFNEMYGWDSYFIIRGLIEDNQLGLAFGMLENFFFEIQHYGGVLNANRTYYLTRAQPPFLTSMIRAIYKADTKRLYTNRNWLRRAYAYAKKDYEIWITPPHKVPSLGLSRYYDFASGPVPEMIHTPDYYQEIIRYFLAHPEQNHGYLITPTIDPAAIKPVLKEENEHPIPEGRWQLSPHFYQGDRAMRESGLDTSFRFGPFGADTTDYIPVDLNSLLFKTEKDFVWIAQQLGKAQEAAKWRNKAHKRQQAMNRYLWNEKKGLYVDYNIASKKQSDYIYATTFYPLWAQLATAQQAKKVMSHLHEFERKGGLVMSITTSGEQWDYPYGWAPMQLIAVEGFDHYGFYPQAKRIAQSFLNMLAENFVKDKTLLEKYDVVLGTSKTHIQIGYKANMTGFGWTNGVALVLLHHYSEQTPKDAPAQTQSMNETVH